VVCLLDGEAASCVVCEPKGRRRDVFGAAGRALPSLWSIRRATERRAQPKQACCGTPLAFSHHHMILYYGASDQPHCRTSKLVVALCLLLACRWAKVHPKAAGFSCCLDDDFFFSGGTFSVAGRGGIAGSTCRCRQRGGTMSTRLINKLEWMLTGECSRDSAFERCTGPWSYSTSMKTRCQPTFKAFSSVT